MTNSKKPSLISYSRISAEKQIGITRIQGLLRSDGYLDGKEPTEKAYRDGIVVEIRELDDGIRMVMFNYDVISDYLEKHGFSGCHETRIGNRHAMLDRLTEAGQIISSILERRRKIKGYDRASRIAGYWAYECPHELLLGTARDAKPAMKKYLEGLKHDRESIISCFKRVRLSENDKNQYDMAMKKIEACIVWLEKV